MPGKVITVFFLSVDKSLFLHTEMWTTLEVGCSYVHYVHKKSCVQMHGMYISSVPLLLYIISSWSVPADLNDADQASQGPPLTPPVPWAQEPISAQPWSSAPAWVTPLEHQAPVQPQHCRAVGPVGTDLNHQVASRPDPASSLQTFLVIWTLGWTWLPPLGPALLRGSGV